MEKDEEYRNLAAEALDLAQHTESSDERLALLEIAQNWLDMAGAHWTPTRWMKRAPAKAFNSQTGA